MTPDLGFDPLLQYSAFYRRLAELNACLDRCGTTFTMYMYVLATSKTLFPRRNAGIYYAYPQKVTDYAEKSYTHIPTIKLLHEAFIVRLFDTTTAASIASLQIMSLWQVYDTSAHRVGISP